MGVKDYSLNADDNTQINGINIAEGCPPSGINNAVRQLMADVKEDSDAQSEALKKFSETPASAEELGPVKVGDGLTMGEDGTLSADLATAEAPGRVKASTTAQAGAVPLGGDDGSLGEDWLKKAMDAADAAQKTADNKTTPAQVAEYGAPDFARIVSITLSGSFGYQVPADGFIKIDVSFGSGAAYLYIHARDSQGAEDTSRKYIWGASSSNGGTYAGIVPVKKGVFIGNQAGNTSNTNTYFIPAKGADWDA